MRKIDAIKTLSELNGMITLTEILVPNKNKALSDIRNKLLIHMTYIENGAESVNSKKILEVEEEVLTTIGDILKEFLGGNDNDKHRKNKKSHRKKC